MKPSGSLSAGQPLDDRVPEDAVSDEHLSDIEEMEGEGMDNDDSATEEGGSNTHGRACKQEDASSSWGSGGLPMGNLKLQEDHSAPLAWGMQTSERIRWLQLAAEGLMPKLYKLARMIDQSDCSNLKAGDAVWRSGLLPDFPKLCSYLVKKFPEHPRNMQLEKMDRTALEVMASFSLQFKAALEPWYSVLVDTVRFKDLSLQLLSEMSGSLVCLSHTLNPAVLKAFMQLFCNLVRVNLLTHKAGKKLIVQVYTFMTHYAEGGDLPEDYAKVVAYAEAYDIPLRGLLDDMKLIGPQVAKVLDAIAPVILSWQDPQKLRADLLVQPFLSWPQPFSSRQQHEDAMQVQLLPLYREWALLGLLTAPIEVLKITTVAAYACQNLLLTTYALPIFRDEFVCIHEEVKSTVLPWMDETRKAAKASLKSKSRSDVRAKQSMRDYSNMKDWRKTLSDMVDTTPALLTAMEEGHRIRRIMLKFEASRILLLLTDQPSLIGPHFQTLLALVSMIRSELLWFFSHSALSLPNKNRAIVKIVDADEMDGGISDLLHINLHFLALFRRYSQAISAFSTSLLAASASRIAALMGQQPVAHLQMEELLRSFLLHMKDAVHDANGGEMENMKDPRSCIKLSANDDVSNLSLQQQRQQWLVFSLLLSSAFSQTNARQLHQASLAADGTSVVSECCFFFDWSTLVDDLAEVIHENSTLKSLCFLRTTLIQVFRKTMFGPTAHPSHAIAWLQLADAFLEHSHPNLPDEEQQLLTAALEYADSLLEAIMGGVEFLMVNLESEKGIGGLDQKNQPASAALLMNFVQQMAPSTDPDSASALSAKVSAIREIPAVQLPGVESQRSNRSSMLSLESALHSLVAVVTAINQVEPVRVATSAFVPREYLRDLLAACLRRRLRSTVLPNGHLQRPVAFEASIKRFTFICHVMEACCQLDLSRTIREVFLSEAFAFRMRDLQQAADDDDATSHSCNPRHTPAISLVVEWYLQFVACDAKAANIVFSPFDLTFRSTAPSPAVIAELVTDTSELEALVRLFGLYAVDCMAVGIRQLLMQLLQKLEEILRANKSQLGALAAKFHIASEREAVLGSLVDLDLVTAICIQMGHCLHLLSLLAKAVARVSQDQAPLIFSVLRRSANHLPWMLPEDSSIARLKRIATKMGAAGDLCAAEMRALLLEIGGVGDAGWASLPFLLAAMLNHSSWAECAYIAPTLGFSNNANCLVRAIHSLIDGCEAAGAERRELKRALLAAQREMRGTTRDGDDYEDHEEEVTEEKVIQAARQMMRTFVQYSSCLVFSDWEKGTRGQWASKVIFLDQLCNFSPLLPRTTLEPLLPFSLIRAAYDVYHDAMSRPSNSPLPLSKVGQPFAAKKLLNILQPGTQDVARDDLHDEANDKQALPTLVTSMSQKESYSPGAERQMIQANSTPSRTQSSARAQSPFKVASSPSTGVQPSQPFPSSQRRLDKAKSGQLVFGGPQTPQAESDGMRRARSGPLDDNEMAGLVENSIGTTTVGVDVQIGAMATASQKTPRRHRFSIFSTAIMGKSRKAASDTGDTKVADNKPSQLDDLVLEDKRSVPARGVGLLDSSTESSLLEASANESMSTRKKIGSSVSGPLSSSIVWQQVHGSNMEYEKKSSGPKSPAEVDAKSPSLPKGNEVEDMQLQLPRIRVRKAMSQPLGPNAEPL